MRCTPSTTTTRGLSNNGTVSGDSELKTAGLLAAIRICSLVAAKMAMVVITESERVVCTARCESAPPCSTRCSLRLAWRRGEGAQNRLGAAVPSRLNSALPEPVVSGRG